MDVSNEIPKINKEDSLISIIVPAYNVEAYLPTCVESILTQSFKNIEIILVDDGSTDQTGKIIDDYQSRYPEKIIPIHIENGGVMNARMIGIGAASGMWIGFVDSDDVIEPDMYERLFNNALKYDADISHCGYQTIVNDGERVHYFYNTGKLIEQDNITGLRDLLTGTFVEPGLCNKLFHKMLFQTIIAENQIDTSIRINEDLLLNYLLFKVAKKSVYEDFCPYHYITRSDSATRSHFKEYRVLDPIKVRKIILDDSETELKHIAWNKYLVSCLNGCLALHKKAGFQDHYTKIKKELEEHSDKWKYLGRNEAFKMKLFMLSPILYKGIISIYERYFQKKIYE